MNSHSRDKMAIVSCKECKKDMSDKARHCPHCGVSPSYLDRLSAKKFLCLIFVFFLSFCSIPPNLKNFAIKKCIEECSKNATKCEEECRSKTWIDGCNEHLYKLMNIQEEFIY